VVEQYKTVDGITTPSKLTNEMGAVAMTMTFTSIRFNESVPATMFALPPEIQALVDASKK
jgi:outer membrane lipoprotein-sorting protein